MSGCGLGWQVYELKCCPGRALKSQCRSKWILISNSDNQEIFQMDIMGSTIRSSQEFTKIEVEALSLYWHKRTFSLNMFLLVYFKLGLCNFFLLFLKCYYLWLVKDILFTHIFFSTPTSSLNFCTKSAIRVNSTMLLVTTQEIKRDI